MNKLPVLRSLRFCTVIVLHCGIDKCQTNDRTQHFFVTLGLCNRRQAVKIFIFLNAQWRPLRCLTMIYLVYNYTI